MAGADSKSGSSSLSEFDKTSNEFPTGSEQAVRSLRSSTSSLAEFERLENQLCIDDELEAEAKKVANLLEEGSLPIMAEHPETDTSSGKGTPASDVSSVLKHTEAQVEEPSVAAASAADYPPYQDIVQIIREASKNVEMFDFQEAREESIASPKHVPVSIEPHTEQVSSGSDLAWERLETPRVEAYSKHSSDLAIPILSFDAKVEEKDQSHEFFAQMHIEERSFQAHIDDDITDSLDEEVSSEMFITERATEIGLQEKELTDADVDSLQDTESHKSFIMGSDSLHDLDSILHASTEYDLETTSAGVQYLSLEPMDLQQPIQTDDPLFMSSDSLQIQSFDIVETSHYTMDKSADSLAMEGAIGSSTDSIDLKFYKLDDVMERSADSLEADSKTMPESQSCESFETDSLQGEQTIVTTSMSQDSLKELPFCALDMSIESGQWSQSSFSSTTLISSGRDIMQMSVDSQIQDKISSTDTSPRTTSEGKQLDESGSDSTPTSWHQESFTLTSLSTDNLQTAILAVFDSEGNLMPYAKDTKSGIDDEGNLQSAAALMHPKDKKLHAQDSKSSVQSDVLEEYELHSETSTESSFMHAGIHSYDSDVKPVHVDLSLCPHYQIPSEPSTEEGETGVPQSGSKHLA